MSIRRNPACILLLFATLLAAGPRFGLCADRLIRPNKTFALSEEERQFIDSLEPLRVMVDDNFSPLSRYNLSTQQYEGISIDLFRHIAQALHLKYEFIYKKGSSWSQKVVLFKKNEADMLLPTSINKKRSEFGYFTRSYYTTYYGAIARGSRKIEINKTTDLALYKIGVTKSTAIIPFIQKFVPEKHIRYYDNQLDLYQAIRNGEIDLGLRNKYVFQEERYNMELFDLGVIHTLIESPRNYSYFFRKIEPYERLVAIIDRYMAGADSRDLVTHYERGEEELITRYVKQKNQQKILAFVLTGTLLLLCCISMGYVHHLKMTRKLGASLEQIKESDEQLRALYNSSFNGIIIHDGDTILDCNRELSNMTGYPVPALKGMSWLSLIAPEWHAGLTRLAASQADHSLELEGLRQNGSRYPLPIKGKPFHLQGREVQMCEFQGITDRKRSERALEELNDKLEALSTTDPLTGIANRRRFDAALTQEYARHARSGACLSLIMLDVDKFKEFNDTYGHVSGDACLQRIAEVMTVCATRPADLVARYGGEEFTCLLPETDLAGALAIAEQMRLGIMELGIDHERSPVASVVTASMGVASARCAAGGSPLDLVIQVDALLYRAKAKGRNRVEGPRHRPPGAGQV
jgi:diguanylate cyclase (GGDEF)-like protein/PAS domain S-box-containing protein